MSDSEEDDDDDDNIEGKARKKKSSGTAVTTLMVKEWTRRFKVKTEDVGPRSWVAHAVWPFGVFVVVVFCTLKPSISFSCG